MQNYTDNPTVQKHRWWIITAVGMFTIMSTLDASIVNIALPVMSEDLHVPMNQAEWIVSIYLIVICALLLLMGKLGDTIGKIKIFQIGTVLFTVGSLLAGFNHSFYLLLFARVLQALGASMTMATNNGIITEVFPQNERGKALGLIGSFVAIGSIAGPGIGGLILGVLPWGYIFWINIPLGIVTMIVGHFVLPKDLNVRRQRIDWPGFASYVLAIIPFFLAVSLGQEVGFTRPFILALFAVAIVAFVIFLRVEKRQEAPLVSLKLFKNQAFTISLLCGFLIFVANFFSIVTTPFYLENARGFSATHAGYLMMVFPIVQVVIAPLSGMVTDRIGPYALTLVGLVAITIAQVGYMFWHLQSSIVMILLVIAINGFGNGVFQSPNNTIIMSAVAPADLGVAGGLNALARNLGMVVGISAATTMLFASMSHISGKAMTVYPTGNDPLFIAGMRVTFVIAVVLCVIAFGLTIYRITHRKAQ